MGPHYLRGDGGIGCLLLLVLLLLQLLGQLQVAERGSPLLLLQGQGNHVVLVAEEGATLRPAPNSAVPPDRPTNPACPSLGMLPKRRGLPYLVDLPLIQVLLLGGIPGGLLARSVAEVELGIAEAAVPVHVVQALPGHLLLVEEALVGDQQVQVALGGEQRPQNQRSEVVAARLPRQFWHRKDGIFPIHGFHTCGFNPPWIQGVHTGASSSPFQPLPGT